MAIIYEFYKENDNDILKVFQKSIYKLYYISGITPIEVAKGLIKPLVAYNLPTTKDGKYQLVLSANNEIDKAIEFNVVKFLQKSIIVAVKGVLCNCSDIACTENVCITLHAEKALKYKSIYSKLLTLQYVYLPLYVDILIFNAYVRRAVNLASCKSQETVNNIINSECMHGSVDSVDDVNKRLVAIYWFGMYYIEYKQATTDEKKKYLNDKYKYESIANCLCDICLSIEELKAAYDAEDEEEVIPPDPTIPAIVHYSQFNNVTDDISFAAGIDQTYIDSLPLVALSSFRAGYTFNYAHVGRIIFTISNISNNKYKIFDTFGTNVTTTVFDTYYNVALETQIFISKNFVTPSALYFKLVQ